MKWRVSWRFYSVCFISLLFSVLLPFRMPSAVLHCLLSAEWTSCTIKSHQTIGVVVETLSLHQLTCYKAVTRLLSKLSTNIKLLCKKILADSANLLSILSKSTFLPDLRNTLTIFLRAWTDWARGSLFTVLLEGAPRTTSIKSESSTCVIHAFSSSHVLNISSPSKLSRSVLKWDSQPVWM